MNAQSSLPSLTAPQPRVLVVAVVAVAVVTVKPLVVAVANAVVAVATESVVVAVVTESVAEAVVTESVVAVVTVSVVDAVKAVAVVRDVEKDVPLDSMKMVTLSSTSPDSMRMATLSPARSVAVESATDSRASLVKELTPWTSRTVPDVAAVATVRVATPEETGAPRRRARPLRAKRPRAKRRPRKELPVVSALPLSKKRRKKLVTLLPISKPIELPSLPESLLPLLSLELARRSRTRSRRNPTTRSVSTLLTRTSHGEILTPSDPMSTLPFLVSALPSMMTSRRDLLVVVDAVAVVAAVVAVAVMAVIVSLAVVAVRVAVVASLISRTTTTSQLYEHIGTA